MSESIKQSDLTAGGGGNKIYLPYLLLIAGLGGLLAGVDFGIIASALIYLDKTIKLSEAELSFIVAVYTLGCTFAALFAGGLADWLGRKMMMIAGGLMFVISIILIYTSQGFLPLFLGRVLMGLSGGVICVVVPLYMAECLPSKIRGTGTAIFQFMLTLGIVIASAIGIWFASIHDVAVELAAGDAAKIFAADNAAWRNMFLVAIIPGIFYSIGAFFIKESPRWLFRRGRLDEAKKILDRSLPAEQAQLEFAEMGQHAAKQETSGGIGSLITSLFQRKYMLPFLIACIVLACTQATGINAVLAYAVVIFKQSGLDDVSATTGNLILTVTNCAITLIALALVDIKGRKFLLKIGTGGIIVSLIFAVFLFRSFESQSVDVDTEIRAMVKENKLELDITKVKFAQQPNEAIQLSILCNYGDKQEVVRAFMPTPEAAKVLDEAQTILNKFSEQDRTLIGEYEKLKKSGLEKITAEQKTIVSAAGKCLDTLSTANRETLKNAKLIMASQLISLTPPEPVPASKLSQDAEKTLAQAKDIAKKVKDGKEITAAEKEIAASAVQIKSTFISTPLEIKRAKISPIPSSSTGWMAVAVFCCFIASFAVGPGVCVWLALTELMPTRIRSMGIGIAMMLNTGVNFLIALFFLPVVGNYGFSAMFLFWIGCTVIYFITAALMPETKGKTLEEIEDHFEGKKKIS